MSQSQMLKQKDTSKTMEGPLKRLKITVPKFDTSSLIGSYSKTLIGRCMNPAMQDMKALLYMLPRIWKMEERVAGADLGLGSFQFDFDREEDIQEVMKMEPFHFDYWMLSLVRWAPVVDPNYPSAIKFWVRIIGVPLHFWADVTFESIGKALGVVKAVNLDEGKIQVEIDGLKPLVFETAVEFDGGEETIIYLRYERLFGFCRICQSLCHDQSRCPTRMGKDDRNMKEDSFEEPRNGHGAISYKAATKYGGPGGKDVTRSGGGGMVSNGQNKGKWKAYAEEDGKQGKGRVERRYGDGTSKSSRPSGYIPPNELKQRFEAEAGRVKLLENSVEKKETTGMNLTDAAVLTQAGDAVEHQGVKKPVRKSLSFEDGGLVNHEIMGLEVTNKESDDLSHKEKESTGGICVSQEQVMQIAGNGDVSADLVQHMEFDFETGEPTHTVEGEVAQEEPEDGELFEDTTWTDFLMGDELMSNEADNGDLIASESHRDTEVDNTSIQEEYGSKDMVQAGDKVAVRKKIIKSNPLYLGGYTKKRMVQHLVSPRKKQSGKTINGKGDGGLQGAPKGSLPPKMGQKSTTKLIDADP
ncbi:hypothetical protein EUTSA_v10019737mg [Eutrema salsugineum]|uniref:DUF4283 domain-containing protein n=1 Tax=Eutrema salsugineum TaxID=72664 RepID=V4KCG4_EUTSA|nr:hypothetical protein EUTSA_v10019737mg [Eutrema salsugineum]